VATIHVCATDALSLVIFVDQYLYSTTTTTTITTAVAAAGRSKADGLLETYFAMA
jgi:hypothetical protein